MIKFFKMIEGHILAKSKQWKCELNDQEVPLAVHIEIINMDEATGEKQFKEYPFLVGFQIVGAKPHKSFDESNEPKTSFLSLMYDMIQYMGGVPVDHIFLSTDSLNKNITQELKAKHAKLVTETPKFGTVAAQKPGSSIIYPQFKSYDAAEAWALEMVKLYADTHMTLCGFILDRPINLAGNTGWETIEKHIQGCK